MPHYMYAQQLNNATSRNVTCSVLWGREGENAALLGALECRPTWCAGMPHFLVRSNAALLGAQNDVDT